jgi:hypothetical protein
MKLLQSLLWSLLMCNGGCILVLSILVVPNVTQPGTMLIPIAVKYLTMVNLLLVPIFTIIIYLLDYQSESK